MILDCNYHRIAGDRADNHCRKCARRNGKKKPVDSVSGAGSLLVASSIPSLSRWIPDQPVDQESGGRSYPSFEPVADRTLAALVLAAESKKRRDAIQLQQQLRGKKCVGCTGASIGVVFCFEVCPECGERINEFLAKQPWYPGPCVGELFKKTRSAIAALIRRRR